MLGRLARRGSWETAETPVPSVATDVHVVEVEGATITGVLGGPLGLPGGRHRWMRGAVHDAEGALVPESQRRWHDDVNAAVPADPARIRTSDRWPLLEGTWVYAGHWTRQFGHFFLETLSTLWPEAEQLGAVGVVAHRSFRGNWPPAGRGGNFEIPELKPWQAGFLELAGYGGHEVRIARYRDLRVERLLVPVRPVVLKCWAAPEAAALWDRVGERAGAGDDERVFLSRRLFHRDAPNRKQSVRTDASWDEELEKLHEAAGFRVVHPETLTIQEQLRLVRGASVLSGPAGSALHLSAFARSGTRVLEIGDKRSSDRPMASQRMVDAARGHLVRHVPHHDPRALQRALESLGR